MRDLVTGRDAGGGTPGSLWGGVICPLPPASAWRLSMGGRQGSHSAALHKDSWTGGQMSQSFQTGWSLASQPLALPPNPPPIPGPPVARS